MEHKLKVKMRQRYVQVISLAIFLGIVTLVTILVIPYARNLTTDNGREELMNMINQFSTFWSIIIFVAIQAIQVIIAIIPPVQIVGGLLFGWFWGGLLSFAGTLLGSIVIFLLVRFLGQPLVEAFVSEKQMKKFGFLDNEKKLVRILIILYIIPGVPKDVITYIVPLTKVSRRDLFLYVMPFRLPAIMLSTVFGNSLGKGNYTAAIVLVGVFILIGIIGYFTKDHILNKIRQHRKSK